MCKWIAKRLIWLQRSLRSVAGAPRTARKKKPATPVGMTEGKIRKRQEQQARAQPGMAVPQDAQGEEKGCWEGRGNLQRCNLNFGQRWVRLFVVSPCSGLDAAGNLQEESHRPPATFGRSTLQVDEAHHTHYREN